MATESYTTSGDVTCTPRAIADHQGIGDEGFAAAPGAFAGQPEGAAGAKTG